MTAGCVCRGSQRPLYDQASWRAGGPYHRLSSLSGTLATLCSAKFISSTCGLAGPPTQTCGGEGTLSGSFTKLFWRTFASAELDKTVHHITKTYRVQNRSHALLITH